MVLAAAVLAVRLTGARTGPSTQCQDNVTGCGIVVGGEIDL